MAFPSAAGYGNLPNGVFSPVIYSQKVLMTLKKKTVVDEITNTEFAGEINGYGDTVKIIKQPTVTVVDYARGKTLQDQDLQDTDITLTIDQAKAYQFSLDDIEKAHEHVAFEKMAVDSASYSLKIDYDSNILSAISSGVATANNVGSVTVGFGGGNDYTPLDLLSRFAVLLDEQNIPDEDRWFVGSPRFYEALRREDSKFVEAQLLGDSKSVIRNSNIALTATIHGFKMLKSNNLPSNTLLAGHKMATTTANSIVTSETFRSQASFATKFRGLHVYGRKVLRSEGLAKATVTIGDVA